MGTVIAHTTSIRRDGDRRERGASLVEFALLLPVLLCLILGMVTGGLALAAKNSMTNAIREGARLGATLPEDSMTGWDGWAADVKDRVLELAGGDLDGSEVCVEMVEVGGSPSVIGSWPTSGCSLSMAAPSTPNTAETGECLVKVWAERTATLNAGFFSRDLGLTGKAVGLYERGNCPV